MTITKANGIGESRKQRGNRALPRHEGSPIGPVERLETRELLSSFQTVNEKFQWTNGGSVLHEIQFDAAGKCTRVSNGLSTNDCSLGQFGTPPDRIVVTFNSTINKRSFNLNTDASLTGNSNPADPFRLTTAAVSKQSLTLFARGQFAAGSTAGVTLSLHDIQGKKRSGNMSPWNGTFAVGGSPGGSDVTPPRVTSVNPQPGSTSTQPTNFVEALFSEDLDASSVNTGSFQLIGSGGDGVFGNGNDQPIIAQSVTYNAQSDTARFTAQSQLGNDTYQVRLTSSIRDLAGNALDGDQNGQAGGNFVANFRMNIVVQPPWTPPPIGPGDITPPSVTDVTPGLNGVVSSAPTSILATFSEPVDPATVNANTIRVVASGLDGYFGNQNDRGVAVRSVFYNPAARQAVVQLAEPLAEDAYRVEVAGDNGVRDLAGNSLDGDRDGRGGGNFSSEFRVDMTPPAFTLGLGEGSDSGVPADNRTNLPNNVAFSGTVSDGTVGKPANFTVQLDIDGDGFDDGEATTDPLGNFTVAAPPGFFASGVRAARVQITDLAGNSQVMNTTYTVDDAPPAVGFAQPLLSLKRPPATLEVFFNEPMNPQGVRDLKNYALIAAGGDGLFVNGVNDASQYLTLATYVPNENKAVLTVSPSLPADAYRLVVKNSGTMQDLAGNPVQEQVFQDVQVDQFSRDKVQRPPNAQPINPSAIRQFPQLQHHLFEVEDPAKSFMSQLITRSQPGPLVNPAAIVQFPETEPRLGPASNNTTGSCDSATGTFAFGQDSGEDPNIVITGTDFGTADSDFYCFRARAGEIVSFSITDDFGQILATFPTVRIWDLGTDGAPGGTGDAADRPLVDEALNQIFQSNAGNLLGPLVPDFVEVQITGITGSALDNPEREADITTPTGAVIPGNPLGSEKRAPQDRVYALQIDTDRFLGNTVQNYIVTGQFRKPFTTATNLQQIIYVDFDGALRVPGLERFDPLGVLTPITVDVPPFDVREYGFDPIFQDSFIDQVMARMRNDLARVNFQAINTGQNSASGISRFSYELRDSRHFPDPGNAANVTHVYVGGAASSAQLPLGFVGFADEVDTGNQHGANNVFVFSRDLANFDLVGVAPVGFGPARIPDLAGEVGQVASHEVGHALGLWHTRFEGAEFCDFNLNPTCTPSVDNIIDPVIPPLGTDVEHRFDRFRDFGFTIGQVTTSTGLEFFDGVADSIGTLAWDMTGRDLTSPRVLDMKVTPGQIKLVFSEALDLSTLTIGVGNNPTITLERAGFDNDFTSAISIPLLPVGTRAAAPRQADPCSGAIPAGVSLYDSCTNTLTLQVADVSQVVQDDTYRLTLSSVSNRAIRDLSGNALDGEINLPVNRRLNPQGDRFPSGDGQTGGSFQLTFLVTKNIGVDGDFTTTSTGVPGTLAAPYTNIQQALETAQFANLASEEDSSGNELPVRVRVAPAITPYLAFDPRLDPTPLTTTDRGNLVIPDNTHLEIDSSFEIAKELWVASPAPDDPTTATTNESETLPGLIFRVDANSPNGGDARILGSFNAPIPMPGNAGMGYDGTNLYLVHDAAGLDIDADRIYVLDPITGQQINSFLVPVSPAGGANIDGLAVSDTTIYVSDSETNTIFKLDKRPATSTAVSIGNIPVPFDLVGGLDYDAIHDTLWVSGIVSGALQLLELNPHTGAILSTFDAPGGATAISGVGLVDGQPLVADPGENLIFRLNLSNPVASQSFTPPAPGVSALAGVSESHVALKFLGTRIEVAGEKSALVAHGSSIDNPVVFTSTRDNTVLGSGVSSAAPADWMGIAFRPPSDDFASRLENVAIHFAGGPGTIIPGVTQTLSPITLFDARPSIINAEISNNSEAAIAATPDSFERLLGRSGPELFWDVDAGVPIPGDWDPTTPGTEFGLYQSNTGKVFVDLNGDRQIERTEDLNCNDALDVGEDQNRNFTLDKNDLGCVFGAPGEVPLVGNFSDTTDGDEIATFDRRTGLWNVDRNRDFTLNFSDDSVAIQFGQHGDVPIVGDWDGDGVDQLGVYRPHPQTSDSECLDAAAIGVSCFILDLNNNLSVDAGEAFLFGERTDKPVVGDFAPGIPGDEIGVYRPTSGDFLLDRNGNRVFDMGERDLNGDLQEDPNEVIGTPNGVLDVNDGPIAFGPIGGRPVIGDWCTDNVSTATIECPGDEIGVVDASLKWLLDSNGSLKQDAGELATQFGQAGDVPTPGDWATDPGEAGSEVGVFRPTIGQWFVDSDSDNTFDASEDLDLDGHLDVNEDVNGNGKLDVGEDKDEDGRLDVAEDRDPDGAGPLQKNGLLDTNDGGFKFTAALRIDITQFVTRNSLNAVWVKPGFQTVSDAHWNDIQLPHVLTGPVDVQALPAIGVVPTLQIEPGMIVKMGQANLAVGGFGSTLLIDSDLSIDEPRVVFTSLLDDARGPNGQRHDTNNDQGAIAPLPGDWGGIVASQGASVIINGADIQYGGNLRIPFRGFVPGIFPQTGLISPNPITLNGGPIFATITNNIIANTNNVNNTSNPRTRPSDIAAIGVVDANSLGSGPNLPRIPFNANPFIRGNDVSTNNGLNGLEIRTDGQQPAIPSTIPDSVTVNTFISQDSVWDDTDITHILLGTINWDSLGFVDCLFLRFFNIDIPCSITLNLRSNAAGTYDGFDGTINGPAESLVIKLGGRFSTPFTLISPFPAAGPVIVVGAGFQLGWDDGNANTPFQGFPDDWGEDSKLVVEGVPGNSDVGIPQTPVVFTSIRDDSIGAGGVQEDTNNDASTTAAAPGDWAGLVIGAWAQSTGRISPLNGAPLSPSYVRDADIRFAATGVLAQSQSVEVSNTSIRSSRDFGINAVQGPVLPNVPQGRNPNNLPRQPAAIQVWNSELISNATGIHNAGGQDQNFPQEPQPPRGVIINNTLHQNGTAISLTSRAGPLIMNNAITSVGNTGNGILIDNATLNLPFENPPQHEQPQLLRNLFFGLANNGFTGTVPRGLGGLEIVGVDPAYTSPGAPDFNFRPSPNSPLVDASMSEFGQPTIFDPTFDSLWGMVNAPERDKFGAFRRDHFGTPGIGVGTRPWLDIGAVELTDVLSAFPRVVSMNPLPNTNFANGFGPASVELEFSEPVNFVSSATYFVEASGGDQSFQEGNEVRLVGQVSAVLGSGGTRWVFTPNAASGFNNFHDETFRVTAIGTGSTPISSVASGSALDGEFLGAFPSGDGVEGGDFHATFTIGDVITGRILFVDDDTNPCPGVPRNDPNLLLFSPNSPAPGVFPPGTGIARALAVAQAGDTILVCPGVYTSPLTFTVPVTIESIEGALPRKNSLGQIIPGTGTFIAVTAPLGTTAITLNNVSGQRNPRIGSTRGGVNHGFVITTSPISGPVTAQPSGIGIDAVATAVDIEGNVIISNTIGIRADSSGTSRLPNILNNIIVGNTRSGTGGGAGIDITSRSKEALATIVNNTISYNQSGILLREDGQDPLGRVVATVQNNVISSNSLTGLSTVSSLAKPNVFNNDAWGNANQTSNFGGSLSNITPSTPPEPDCTAGLTRCGNISANPLFINPVDPRGISDRSDFFRLSSFELQAASPLIDRGLDEGAAVRDFKGRTRTIDVPNVGHTTSPPPPPTPDSEPRSVDIGAYEFVPSGVASSIGERSGPATALSGVAMSGATDDLLDQLGTQVSNDSFANQSSKRRKLLIDDWLDDEWGN